MTNDEARSGAAKTVAMIGGGLVMLAFIGGLYMTTREDPEAASRSLARAMGASVSEDARAEAPPLKPLFSAIPQVYDDWQRTDYLGLENAREELSRQAAALGVTPETGSGAKDAAAAVFSNGGQRFVIYMERGRAGAVGEGETVRIAGLPFRGEVGAGNLLNLKAASDDGLRVLLVGRASPDTVAAFLEDPSFAGLGLH